MDKNQIQKYFKAVRERLTPGGSLPSFDVGELVLLPTFTAPVWAILELSMATKDSKKLIYNEKYSWTMDELRTTYGTSTLTQPEGYVPAGVTSVPNNHDMGNTTKITWTSDTKPSIIGEIKLDDFRNGILVDKQTMKMATWNPFDSSKNWNHRPYQPIRNTIPLKPVQPGSAFNKIKNIMNNMSESKLTFKMHKNINDLFANKIADEIVEQNSTWNEKEIEEIDVSEYMASMQYIPGKPLVAIIVDKVDSFMLSAKGEKIETGRPTVYKILANKQTAWVEAKFLIKK